ncbi:MAG: hydroxyacylglutathione hydrolase [Myxococcales bacterium]|nr:hydroxyacylglutathione hydrolase [Myxococcales bacterium]
MSLEITLVPVLSDNYSYILHCTKSGAVALVDCPDADAMIQTLERMKLQPTMVLNTHHHFDHVGGNEDLKKKWPALEIVGYGPDSDRIPCITRKVEEGERIKVGEYEAEIMFTPAHTRGHIAYYFADAAAVFCGDTLFFGGCGRFFEGTPAEMHDSLQKLAALPEDTRVYCGHEYTASNLRFARHVEPNNAFLAQTYEEVLSLREREKPTIPSTIAQEKQVNPFLRTHIAAVQQATATQGADPHDAVSVLGALREMKNNF